MRRLEDVIYELSLFPPSDAVDDADGAKAADGAADATDDASAAASSPPLLDIVALERAREAYSALDNAREAVIKKCREPQKLSKQAIFALQRGDTAGAAKQLGAARRLAQALLADDLVAFPVLRQQGCVKAMLEELAEAVLFERWLMAVGASSSAGESEGPLVHLGDEGLLGADLQASEYLGGVCDLVGEVGRYAVRRATDRDAPAIREALSTAVAVQTALLLLGGAAPRSLSKKTDALRTSVRKMETLLYELSLVERSGRTRAEPTELPPDHVQMQHASHGEAERE